MPLCSFSEPAHVPLLLNGRKQQTTRFERVHPLKPGDILYCYYRARMKKSCRNCITQNGCAENTMHGCKDWNNYFGEAEVIHVRPLALYHNNMEAWAIADGFESLSAADAWFWKTYHKTLTQGMPYLEVISFAPGWLK